MLPLLNLQVATPAIADDMLGTARELPPEGGVEPFAGFAALLKLRIADAAADGEVLPPAGSDLPLTAAIELSADVAAERQIEVELLQLPRPELSAESQPVDVVALAAEIAYPPTDEPLPVPITVSAEPAAATAILAEAALISAAPGADATAPLLSDVAGSPQTDAELPVRPDVGPPVSPVLAIKPTDSAAPKPVITAGDRRSEVGPLDPAVTRRDPLVLAQTASPSPPQPVAERALPQAAELPVRHELSPAQRDAAVAQAVTELARPDRIVQQSTQTLQAGPNGHQATLFAHAPSAPAISTDPAYASIARDVLDTINTPVRDAAWGDRLGERVVMMAGSQLKTAEIRLTPAELGPLRVQVAIDDGAANVTFHAQHAPTRDAIEQALPRLREMLAENGLALGDAHVGGEGVAAGHREQHEESGPHGAQAQGMTNGAADEQVDAPLIRVRGAGLVDTFA